ncbi:MAG: aspartate carbamoyltransferase catalytic subunit [Chloracidobacterium sp.]|nr:aspartate carbamoyltransferase catalytic subunit [Chloracidobacterium sp.]MDW8216573.1 aspartate carbamoyltransferase catalytic subunit [Acidobacteriota bacterium]
MKDFLDTSDLTPALVTELLDRAERFLPLTAAPDAVDDRLRGKHLVTLFSEASTRTRTSFELAAKRLGMKVVNIVVGMSSLAKGETLRDTILTLDAMMPDVVVVRHAVAGVPHFMARFSKAHFINAGDGEHEHPTQALLDAFTLRRRFGRLEGLEIAILGDIRHSRVARSNVRLLAMMGAHVRLGGPRTLRAPGIERFADGWPGTVRVTDSIREALTDADAVMVLRIQQERLDGAFFPSLGEYFTHFGLTRERLAWAKPDAPVLHPGPINREVEIASDVADGVQSLIQTQVTHGVAVRMALLEWLLSREATRPRANVS